MLLIWTWLGADLRSEDGFVTMALLREEERSVQIEALLDGTLLQIHEINMKFFRAERNDIVVWGSKALKSLKQVGISR